MELIFVETEEFTELAQEHGADEALRGLQDVLREYPEKGRTDPGTGGLRKIRVPDRSRGKGRSSGLRVHYLYLEHVDHVYFLFLYGKDQQDTLTPLQKKALRQVVANIKTEWRGRSK